jgi:hypothetical protein
MNSVIELLVGKPFIDFAELSKLNLLTTNHDLLRDGLNKHHIVLGLTLVGRWW